MKAVISFNLVTVLNYCWALNDRQKYELVVDSSYMGLSYSFIKTHTIGKNIKIIKGQ